MNTKEFWQSEVIHLLKKLISTPSMSREEEQTGGLIESFLRTHGCSAHRKKHNIWARNRYFDENKPVLLLNSHHDTVKPNQGYTKRRYRVVMASN